MQKIRSKTTLDHEYTKDYKIMKATNSIHKTLKKLILLITGLLLLNSCTGEAVFSPLVNTRLKLILKGTYESNNPDVFGTLHEDDGSSTLRSAYSSSAMDTTWGAVTKDDLQWYIDIAEIRISTRTDDFSGDDPTEYWSLFARDRMLMCSTYNSNKSGKYLDSCSKQNGISQLANFFEEGISYPATDLGEGTYKQVAIYFRKLITSPAYSFASDGTSANMQEVNFDNQPVNGYNVLSLMQNSPGGDGESLLFPLHNNNLNLTVTSDGKPYVIEARVFLKNLMMKHTAKTSSGWLSFISPSDWSENHLYDTDSDAGKVGGNVLMTARLYYPDNVGSLKITGAVDADYVAVMPAGASFDPLTQLPYAATTATNKTITNLPPGTYDVYATCDLTYKTCSTDVGGTMNDCTAETDTANVGKDGFPEKHVACGTSINVTANNTAIDATACDCQP